MKRLVLAGLALVAVLSAAQAKAQPSEPYPVRSITIVVPVPAGGGVDRLARIVADILRTRLGQPVVVENRPGAGGNVGANMVFRAAPDGHTLLYTAGGVLVTNKLLYANMGFAPAEFAPVSVVVASYGTLLVVPNDVPAATLKQFINLARTNPDKLTYASPGIGTGGHLTTELFKSMAGLRIRPVHYKGGADALVDVLGGRVSVMIAEVGSVLPLIQSGKVRVLAVTSEKRLPILPDVPAVSEELPGFVSSPWNGMVAPPKTPRAISVRLSRILAEEFKQPAVVKMLAASYREPVASTPDEMERFMQEEIERWTRVVREIGLKAR